ncbi:hypothetical protein M896_042050 [Ordospora colligata OC4]|uniref:Thioredoxin domain-containing protein n=1 Tax=Ordospora colligata OC4 TaxID=1354746 RepID=A0A0B2ULY8_9MICR|nr:uncharacterized protein M896_042050 [Ordospora colligata OC4]KHN70005.1 hypothetical protein M896_042050 [Ordospora colligata OC4]TBU16175.1 hypothetical protein CWI41_042040 [Ordospora colligata]TBU16388.1 hypothetical protein CWI40_042040 [Ordospora colligata]
MRFVLLLGSVLSSIFLSVPDLQRSDLASKEIFLAYIYYSRPNMSCAACEMFNKNISELQRYIPVKKINFFEEPRLGSSFYTFLFPSFVVRDEGRSYHLPVDDYADLEAIVREKRWREFKVTRRWMDVDSYFIKVYSVANHVFFALMQRSYKVIDVIPGWIVSLGFSGAIAYMLYCICIIFVVPGEKEKRE